MILDLIKKIEFFLNLESKNPNKNLLEGRRIQSQVHQAAAFCFPSIFKDKESIKNIEKIAEEEQDSLSGIENNLRSLLQKMKELN